MATTSIRATVKARLVTVFRAVLVTSGPAGAAVRVEHAIPNDLPRELVCLGHTTGALEAIAMVGGTTRKPMTDVFTVDVWIRSAMPGATAAVAEARVEAIYGAVRSALVDPTVCGPDLKGGSTYAAIDGLYHVKPTDVEGPNSAQTPEGWAATIRLTLTATTRLV